MRKMLILNVEKRNLDPANTEIMRTAHHCVDMTVCSCHIQHGAVVINVDLSLQTVIRVWMPSLGGEGIRVNCEDSFTCTMAAVVAYLLCPGKHPVSMLNELCSKRRWHQPRFELMEDMGPAHHKSFRFKVQLVVCCCDVCSHVSMLYTSSTC